MTKAQEITQQSGSSFTDLAMLFEAYKAAMGSAHVSTRVGAVLTNDDGKIVARAYNGFPEGIPETLEAVNNPEIWDLYELHPEIRVLLALAAIGIKEAQAGDRKANLTLYITHTPCSSCASAIVAAHGIGLKTVVLDADSIMQESKYSRKWLLRAHQGRQILQDSGVAIRYFSSGFPSISGGDRGRSWAELKRALKSANGDNGNDRNQSDAEVLSQMADNFDWMEVPLVKRVFEHLARGGEGLAGKPFTLEASELCGRTALVLCDLRVSDVIICNDDTSHAEYDFALRVLKMAGIPTSRSLRGDGKLFQLVGDQTLA